MKHHRTGEYREPKKGEWFEGKFGTPLELTHGEWEKAWILRTTDEPPDAFYYVRENEIRARAERAEARVKELENAPTFIAEAREVVKAFGSAIEDATAIDGVFILSPKQVYRLSYCLHHLADKLPKEAK